MRDRLAGEAGFTVIELLVAATLMVLVLLPTFMVLEQSTRHAHRDTARATTIDEAQTGLNRLVRELRHTTLVHSSTAQVLEVTVTRRGVDSRVRFDCTVTEPGRAPLRRCTRTVVSGPGAGSTEPLIQGIEASASTVVFTYTPAAGIPKKHVAIEVALAVDDAKSFGHRGRAVLADGTGLRNVDA
jgi:Tfp pilus assembly protein PilW